jgi:hypothetical protein
MRIHPRAVQNLKLYCLIVLPAAAAAAKGHKISNDTNLKKGALLADFNLVINSSYYSA